MIKVIKKGTTEKLKREKSVYHAKDEAYVLGRFTFTAKINYSINIVCKTYSGVLHSFVRLRMDVLLFNFCLNN